MPKKKIPLSSLAKFLPAGSSEPVMSFLEQHKVQLTIAKERSSILGDYRHQTTDQAHRISVNGNLKPFSFLITLLHELAHLITFNEYGHKVKAHGTEWKKNFSEILQVFIQQGIFPGEIVSVLQRSIRKPAASSCADADLIKILKKHEGQNNGLIMVEELPDGSRFMIKDGRVFKKGQKLRKRFKCEEPETKKFYLFSPVYEVKLLEN